MPEESSSVGLLRAVLAEHCASDKAARQHLELAQQLGVDPLDYAAHRFGIGTAPVWQRASRWAGFPFSSVIPCPGINEAARPAHLDGLGEMRSIRQSVLGRDLTFAAPRFAQVANLARSRETRPELAGRLCFVPPDRVEAAILRGSSDQLMDNARQRLLRSWPRATASQDLPLRVRAGFVCALMAVIVVVMLSGVLARPVLMPIVALLLLAPGVLRLIAALPRRPGALLPPPLLSDAELPVYTVLIPLRDEAAMVPQLRRAMGGLDYPAEKLDIKFVVEERSAPTVEAVRAILGDPRFRLVVVPDAKPHTKPKALNYALPLARGEYLVVYDAEDAPEPDQLRLAASRFAADPALACLQAELVPENSSENALTALFAGEYAGLFGRLLPALSEWGLPVPLGGTSNHFRIGALRELGGWDAFNVTEDADLGVRLARRRLRAETLASRTYEEAPLTAGAWMAQRTRWMKGWMQTFIVHNRAPRAFLRDIGWRGFLGFQVLVGGMILASVLHTVFILSLALHLASDGVFGLVPRDFWDWVSAAILLTGYGGALAVTISGLLHVRAGHLLFMQLLLPAYWVLHSVAAVRAAVDLIRRPNFWAKTTHGVTQLSRGRTQLLGRAEVRPRTG